MKLSQLAKRIQQAESRRAESTRGQVNEDWELYRSNPSGIAGVISGVSWGDLSCLPRWEFICSKAIVHLSQLRVA